jgi:hypothetical protein
MIVKGTQITAIIECGGVWFAGSKFGLTWRAKQIAIHKLPEKMGEFAFKGLAAAPAAEEEDEEKNEIEDDAAFQAPQASKPSAVAAMMPKATPKEEPEEVDDEDADDVEPIPAPRKTIIKKKVVVPPKK